MLLTILNIKTMKKVFLIILIILASCSKEIIKTPEQMIIGVWNCTSYEISMNGETYLNQIDNTVQIILLTFRNDGIYTLENPFLELNLEKYKIGKYSINKDTITFTEAMRPNTRLLITELTDTSLSLSSITSNYINHFIKQ